MTGGVEPVASMAVGFLNAIPPIVSVVAMVLWLRHSDRTGERTWHVIIACVAAAVRLVIAAGANKMKTWMPNDQ